MNRLWSGALVMGLTLLSGFMDAKGFVYASRAWPAGRLDVRMAGASILAFLCGITLYIVSVRFMKNLGITAAALQTGIWFVVTAVGVAVMDGSFLQWTRAQKVVAVVVVLGLSWLAATAHSD